MQSWAAQLLETYLQYPIRCGGLAVGREADQMTGDAPRVLISGASVAGPILAYWLNRFGFQPTVVERTEELRIASGGQAVDLFGPACADHRMDGRATAG